MKDVNSASSLFKNSSPVYFIWRAAEKKISEIPAVYFAETKSLCLAGEGSFNLEHVVDLKISRGEIKNLKLKVPVNQTVTSVVAAGLTNWAFNPKSHQLELVFLHGIKNHHKLVLTSQVQNPSLLKEVSISVPEVLGTTRQYGMLGAGSQEGLKVQVRAKSSVQEIDSIDFPEKIFVLQRHRQPESALYSYNYMKLPMSLTLKASKVVAEIETNVKADLSIGDERLVFNNRLTVDIKKAGVFEVKLNLPGDYEIESLTANGISHWDEINKEGQRQLILYFKNRIKGTVVCNLVLVKNAERKAAEIDAPKVSIVGEKRHRGTLVVSAEQGNRLEIQNKDGIGRVVMVNDGSMSMALLRKDWSLRLSREVLSSRIEVEGLESIDFADTRYKVKGRAIIKVENAGTKFLILKGVEQIQNLEIRGKDIARTEKIAEGTWQVEFKRKIFGEYRLNYQYQTYYDSSQQVQLQGIQFTDAERQRGFLCMTVPSYMSGSIAETNDLQVYEPRLLPKSLASGEDKKSTFCFRTLQSQWQCSMSFTRHSKAEILQANVQNVKIESMVALDGRQLNVVNISIASGSKNFLKMQMPADSHLCSVFSNGKPLKVSEIDEQLLIPLNQSLPGESSRQLQVIYITDRQSFDWQTADFEGPQFDLPLKDINWYLYVPDEKKYDKFAGSMKFIPEAYYFTNSIDQYLKKNKADQQMSREQANVLLEQAYELSNSGRRDLARKNYEAVVSLSDSMSDINEDARVQLQATLRQQTLVGLVNRRENLKASTLGEVFKFDERNYNGGYFSDSFAKAVEKTLEEEESRMLSKVSDKIMSQQAAASRQVMPLKLTLPKEGRQLRFYRQVQIEPMAPMNVTFKTEEKLTKIPGSDKTTKQNILVIALLLVGSLLMMGAGVKKRGVA